MKKSCFCIHKNKNCLVRRNMYGRCVDKVAFESNQPINGNDEVAHNIGVKKVSHVSF
jgi:hypothetical protein